MSAGPGGIVVFHCSDPRFQTHFHEFLRQGLGLDSYALVAVPGGAQFLALSKYLSKAGPGSRQLCAGGRSGRRAVSRPQQVPIEVGHEPIAWAGWRWVKFLGRLQKPVRVILIAHDDCRWYQDSRFLTSRGTARERQVRDMERVRASLEKGYEGVRVDLYLARLEDGGAVFEAI